MGRRLGKAAIGALAVLSLASLELARAQQIGGALEGGQAGYAADIEHQVAILQGLDKITARISPIYSTLGLPTYFGTLEIVVRTCRKTPPTEPPESAAFLEIRELPPAADRDREPEIIFSGWMFASSPAVSALEHPVYDVWVVECEEPTSPALRGQGVVDTISPASE
jgi:hypothetical protein